MRMPVRIVSGGQTGVDRAALDAALHLQIPHSGWCPKGRRAEDGVISDVYALRETDSESYEERTSLNIRDSDATIIIIPSDSDVHSISDGTKLTLKELQTFSKPYIITKVFDSDLNNRHSMEECVQWLATTKPKVLNIAGPRESTSLGIHAKSYRYLCQLFSQFKQIEEIFE